MESRAADKPHRTAAGDPADTADPTEPADRADPADPADPAGNPTPDDRTDASVPADVALAHRGILVRAGLADEHNLAAWPIT